MADKEITQFVVDVGKHMSKVTDGQTLSDLTIGLEYVTDVVISKILKGRKTDLVSLYTVNTPRTNNSQDVNNVETIHEIKQPFINDLQFYKELSAVGQELPESDGIIRALLVALSDLRDFVQKKKYKKNIILITNSVLEPELSEHFQSGLVESLTSLGVQLVVIGIDFDSTSLVREHQKNVDLWSSFLNKLSTNVIITGPQVQSLLESPSPKIVRPVRLFEVQFRIGTNILELQLSDSVDQTDTKGKSKSSEYDEIFQIDQSCVSFTVEGYPGVKAAAPPSRSILGYNEKTKSAEPVKAFTEYEIHNYLDVSTNANELDYNDQFELLKNEYETEIIEKESVVKGYRYGKSTVVLNPALEKQRSYKTAPGLDICGVLESHQLPRAYLTSEATLVLGSKTNQSHQKNLAAVVDALYELDSYAIARFVPKQDSEVQMVVLIPVYIDKSKGLAMNSKRKSTEDDLEDIGALILTRLPFLEDEKVANFPDLTTLKTTSGRIITGENTLLPSKEVEILMDSFVSNFDLDKHSNSIESDFDVAGKRIFNPLVSSSLLPLPESRGNHDNIVKLAPHIHRVNQFLKNTVINGKDVLPTLNDTFQKDTHPDPTLLNESESELNKLKELLNLGEWVDKNSRPKKKRSAMDEVVDEEDEEDELLLEDLLSRGAML